MVSGVHVRAGGDEVWLSCPCTWYGLYRPWRFRRNLHGVSSVTITLSIKQKYYKHVARSRGVHYTIAGGEGIYEVGPVAGLLAVPVSRRGAVNVRYLRAEGTVHAHVGIARTLERYGILPSHVPMRAGEAELRNVDG